MMAVAHAGMAEMAQMQRLQAGAAAAPGSFPAVGAVADALDPVEQNVVATSSSSPYNFEFWLSGDDDHVAAIGGVNSSKFFTDATGRTGDQSRVVHLIFPV